MTAAISYTMWLAIVGIMVHLYGIPSCDAFSPGDGVCSGANTGASALISAIHGLESKIQQDSLACKTSVVSFETKLSNAFLSLLSISQSLIQIVKRLEVNLKSDITSFSSTCQQYFSQISTSMTSVSSSVTGLHSLLGLINDLRIEVTSIEQWISQTSVAVASSTIDFSVAKRRIDYFQVRLDSFRSNLLQVGANHATVKTALIAITTRLATLKTSITRCSGLLSSVLLTIDSTTNRLTSSTNKAALAASRHAKSSQSMDSSIRALNTKMTSSMGSFTGSSNRLSSDSKSMSNLVTSLSSKADAAQSSVSAVSDSLTGMSSTIDALSGTLNTLSVKATSMVSSISSLQSALSTCSDTADAVSKSTTQTTDALSGSCSSVVTKITTLKSLLITFSSSITISLTSITTAATTAQTTVTRLGTQVTSQTTILTQLTSHLEELKVSVMVILTGLRDIIGAAKCAISCNTNGPQVCGSDRVTYTNECHLSKAACHALDRNIIISLQHGGACVSGCVSRSGVHYNNNDVWHEDPCTQCRCQSGTPVCIATVCAHVTCQNPQYLPGECCPICPVCLTVPCTTQYDPVCGSDGKTYGNECELTAAACNSPSLVKVSDGPCTPPSNCPSNFELIDNRCYYFKLPTSVMGQAEATAACSGLGAQLVALQTMTEFRAIHSRVKSLMGGAQNNRNFWTSGREMGPTSRAIAWIWASTNEPIIVPGAWAPSEPNSHSTCAAMYGYNDYKLSDIPCERSKLQEQYGYVCEKAL